MAKRKPKHHAPVAATKSDINGGLARIIELAAKWQAIGQWTRTWKAVKDLRRYLCAVFEATRMSLDNHSQDGEFQAIMKGRSLSKEWSEQVADAKRELLELQNLVRQHIPQLLDCVPDVDFETHPEFGEGFCLNPPEVDHSPLRRDLRKLEGQALVLTLGVKAVDQPMQNDTTVAHKVISLPDAALPTPGDEAGDRRAGMNGDSDEKVPEPQHPFGMKIDKKTRTVKRFNAGISHDSICTISNDDQWNLFMLVVNNNGKVDAKQVRSKLQIRAERGNATSRLRIKLSEIQLTIKHEAGKGYFFLEFLG